MMEQNIRLSQCMIVKNEEKNIERALSWGREIMWEQIVVDTGSTDRTAEIAEQMGAKVYHFPWVDDFAAAKNYAIEQAEGDWIAFLDADEYFLPEDTEKLLPLLTRCNRNGYNAVISGWVQVREDTDVLKSKKEGKLEWLQTVREDGSQSLSLAGTQVRIFRNRPDLRYQGRIHEKLYMEQGEIVCVDASRELSILHTGYSEEEMREKQKTERNIALIRRELEDDPYNYSMLINLGDSYFQQKKYEEAAVWYEQAAVHLPEDLGEDNIQGAMLYKHLLLIYLELQDSAAACRSYENGTARFPREADYDYLMGRDDVAHSRFQQGAYHLQRALALLEQYGSECCSALLSCQLLEAWELLIQCYYENGELQKCVSNAVTVLRAAPYSSKVLVQMLRAFWRDEERERAEKAAGKADIVRQAASARQVKAFLGNLYDLNQKENQEFLRKAAEEAGYDGLRSALEFF